MHGRSPFTRPRTPPVVMPVPVCSLGQRCHVNGKGLTRFGTKFPLAMVQRLASCCIQLTSPNFMNPGNPDLRVASGVLIAPEVALFAGHSLTQGMAVGQAKMILDYECDTATAPPGMRYQYYPGAWPACTSLATVAQAVEVKTLEFSDKTEYDYGMLLIKWSSVSASNTVHLPRVPVFPKLSPSHSDEMILIGHPDDSSGQGEPSQACAFKLVKQRGPNPYNNQGDWFSYGDFGFSVATGFSGGGVFNDAGDLVGLMSGTPGNIIAGLNPNNLAFNYLALVAGRTMNDPRRGRLLLWQTKGDPLKPGDGGSVPPPTFV
jgi:hypothetical protein